MMGVYVVCILGLGGVFLVSSFEMEALHDFMTQPELAYYFQTGDKSDIPDYEVVYLPVVLPSMSFRDLETTWYWPLYRVLPPLDVRSCASPVDLKLRRNQDITSPTFKTYIHGKDGINALPHSPQNCHYLHKDKKICGFHQYLLTKIRGSQQSKSLHNQPRGMHTLSQGLIFLENATLEVHPLTDRLQTLVNLQEPSVEDLIEEEIVKIPHIVKRANFMSDFVHNDIFPIAGNVWSDNEEINPHYYDNFDYVNRNRFGYLGHAEVASTRPTGGGMTLELALFFDEAAYRIFAPHLGNDEKRLQDMLLAYMNGVQALYHHPSLGTSLELVLVRMDIMKYQPSEMPHYKGERGKLLDSFCEYQKKINPTGDANPEHWDMGLYVSGLDFFHYEKGRNSYVTMGLATVGGVCLDQYACVIAEFGTTNIFGKPYPSAGFTSVYILAHEIGHNLGMHHDSSGNSCPKEGYIMSPSRGTNGETQWSRCSADVMAKLGWAKCLQDSGKSPKTMDHSRFLDSPGQVYTAKQQCELLLRDKDATVLPNQELSTICYNLQCNTPHRTGYYFAGPALDGTQCGNKKYCYGGTCTAKKSPKPMKIVPGGMGTLEGGQLQLRMLGELQGTLHEASILQQSHSRKHGRRLRRPQRGVWICEGRKETIVGYASDRCREFSRLLPELDPKGAGLQAPHEAGRVWMGCAIFCRRADSGTFYTPRIELNDLGVTPYFPDGTWCHKEKDLNYYCIQHHCLPENFQLTKIDDLVDDDLSFAQNAYPINEIPQEIKDYLSLTASGKPIKNTLSFGSATPPKDDVWETQDYIEIPGLQDREENRSVSWSHICPPPEGAVSSDVFDYTLSAKV
ncbi:hypothetical protein NQ318_017534, partial [Aromia moschata]